MNHSLDPVFDLVRDVLVRRFKKDASAITMDTELSELDLDSLSITELVFELEDRLGLKMADFQMDTVPARISNLVELLAKVAPALTCRPT